MAQGIPVWTGQIQLDPVPGSLLRKAMLGEILGSLWGAVLDLSVADAGVWVGVQ